MKVNREDLIEMLAERAGYYKKDVRRLLYELDDVVEELLCQADDDDDVVIQLVRGLKIRNHIVPGGRQRRDPRTNEPIICSAISKPWAKFSVDIKEKMQNAYENKKNGEA